jgi:rhamnogalacturonyl hydrolase YesR
MGHRRQSIRLARILVPGILAGGVCSCGQVAEQAPAQPDAEVADAASSGAGDGTVPLADGAPNEGALEGAPPADAAPVDAGLDANGSQGGLDAGISAAAVTGIIDAVARWEIASLAAAKDTNSYWVNAVFYAGLMAAYDATGTSSFADAATSWSSTNQWMVDNAEPGANGQCCGQTYLELYAVQADSTRIASIRTSVDQTIAIPDAGRAIWWWCDALFMAPPAFARLGAVVDAGRYFDTMSTMWWDVVAALYDTDAGLFWRDATFIGKTCSNAGALEFWSRGNGWVMAGTVRVLQFLPASHPARPRFVQLLAEMASAVARLQRSDGFWSSCLTDTTDYPEPEESGTAAFTYALAWGIRAGVLDRPTYLPVVQRGWGALVSAVASSGEVQWVQGTGSAPAHTSQGDTAPYGAGLLLLAASEILKL